MQLRCTWGLLWWRPAGVANTMRKTNCYKCVCLNIFIYLYLSSQFQVKQELDQLCHALCGYCTKTKVITLFTARWLFTANTLHTHTFHITHSKKKTKPPEFSQKWIIPTSDGSPVNIQALQEKQSASISPILRGKLKTSYPGLTSCESSGESGFSFYFCLFVYYYLFVFIKNLLVFFNRVKTN